MEKLTYATTLLTLSERIGILEFTVRSSAGAGKYVEKVEELLKAAKENVRSRTKRGRAGGVARKRPASLQDKSGEKQSGDIGESSTGSRKGGEAEVPSAKRPRVQDEEATGEGSGEQALSDDEDVVIVGVTKGKRKSRWNAVSGQHALLYEIYRAVYNSYNYSVCLCISSYCVCNCITMQFVVYLLSYY